MKRLLILTLIGCMLCALILSASSCSIRDTPNAISDRFDNLAKGYSADKDSGKSGDKCVFSLPASVTFNTATLKEKGDNISGYEIYADNKLIYKSDFISAYKYCSFDAVTSDYITLRVTECKGAWKIKELQLYNITHTASESFEVSSYILADKAYKLNETSARQANNVTDFNIFGSVYFDSGGKLHLQDYLIDGKSVSGNDVLIQGIKNIRAYAPQASIAVTILGNLDMTGDNMSLQQRHKAAMKDNKAVLIDGCKEIIEKYGLDGISFDYEFPLTRKDNKIYASFLTELKSNLPYGKYLTAAMSMWNLGGFKGFPIKKLSCLDRLELMTYDGFDDKGDHSSFYKMCADALYKLQKKGADISKINLGIPFYARPEDKALYSVAYASLATKLGKWGNRLTMLVKPKGKDEYSAMCYCNGRQMVYDKTCYALDVGAGGVMTWHYSCDTQEEEYSLLSSIGKAVSSRK